MVAELKYKVYDKRLSYTYRLMEYGLIRIQQHFLKSVQYLKQKEISVNF